MRWDLMIEAGPVVMVHAGTAVLAFGLGMAVLWRRKGGRLHKSLGKVWVALMVVVSVSSFGINEIRLWGNFSPIHLLSIYTLGSLAFAIYAIRKGDIKSHQDTMRQLFVSALIIAGAFTFLPNRLMARFMGGETLSLAMPFIWLAVPLLVWLVYRAKVQGRDAEPAE
ncbi:DUF2306 domain-containing protein [Pseudahrensia aquimaris]|uniref:DUF2306 domain-containing protein n=1 Tax=Pseudahrensia aquimaris TaxID=744461 RepID=A0ABW3FF28_9HYPH